MPLLSTEQKIANRKIACKKYRDKNKDRYNEYSRRYYQQNKHSISTKRKCKIIAQNHRLNDPKNRADDPPA